MTDHDQARTWAKRLGQFGAWTFDIERLTGAAAREYVRELESLGVHALWIPESLGSKEVFAHAGLLLAASEKLIIATGIANIWARDATAMANGNRALCEAYPERFLLGVGVSHAPVVKMRGASYDKPVEYMGHYLDAMDKAPYTGTVPPEPPGRVLAALGPRMLRLAGERTLGAHPYFVPIDYTPIAREELGPDPLLAVEQACTLEADPAKGREVARRHMKRYLELDNYANNLRRLGWGDPDIGNGGSDQLVDAIVAWGGVDAVKTRAGAHRKGGADHVCLQVLGDDLPGQLRTIAKALL